MVRRILALRSAVMLASAIVVILPSPSTAGIAPRAVAYNWAVSQRGKWYCWGGSGPTCYDCSGLVMAAYRHVGRYFGRTTHQMLTSSQLRRTYRPAVGDLAFYGPGHVELYAGGRTFGAAASGTQVSWHTQSRWWHVTAYYRVVGAG